jgi:hypothetical protein
MHLRMQDDQIGPEIVGLAPDDMAKLSPFIITKNCSKQPSLSAGTTTTLNLPCFT